MNKCFNCKCELDDFEVAINMSLFMTENEKHLCLKCLSKKLNCSTEDLIKYGNNRISQGCALFDNIKK